LYRSSPPVLSPAPPRPPTPVSYQQIDLNLTALGYPATNNLDNPDLKNPWGISHSATSPF
jgi:hypothetical protein